MPEGTQEDPFRHGVPRQSCIELTSLLQYLKSGRQLWGHIYAADLMRLGSRDLPPHDRAPNFNELSVEIDIPPLQADQLSLSHAGTSRTQHERVVDRVPLLRRGQQGPHFVCREGVKM